MLVHIQPELCAGNWLHRMLLPIYPWEFCHLYICYANICQQRFKCYFSLFHSILSVSFSLPAISIVHLLFAPSQDSHSPWSLVFLQFLIIFPYNSYFTNTNPNPNPQSTNEQSPSKCFNITGPFISSSDLVGYGFFCSPPWAVFRCRFHFVRCSSFFNTTRYRIYIVSACLLYIVHWLLQLVQRAPYNPSD